MILTLNVLIDKMALRVFATVDLFDVILKGTYQVGHWMNICFGHWLVMDFC